MKQKRYTEEQIIRILKAHEAGAKVSDLIREHGMSEQSFYRWKSKYGGVDVSDAKELLEMEQAIPETPFLNWLLMYLGCT